MYTVRRANATRECGTSSQSRGTNNYALPLSSDAALYNNQHIIQNDKPHGALERRGDGTKRKREAV